MKCKRPRVGNDLQPDLGTESVHKPALENHRFFSIDSVCCTSVCFLLKMGLHCNISLQPRHQKVKNYMKSSEPILRTICIHAFTNSFCLLDYSQHMNERPWQHLNATRLIVQSLHHASPTSLHTPDSWGINYWDLSKKTMVVLKSKKMIFW